MKGVTVIKVKSDNFEGYCTWDAYCELRLQMSTGDFHTHTHEIVTVTEDVEIYELDDLVMSLE